MLEHPYLEQPKIVVSSKDPKKTLTSASQLVAGEAKEFEREFSRALKR